MKPASYEIKTDWANDNLMICKSCIYYADLGEVGRESCVHPDHNWRGSYTDGPEWNGFCKQWEAEE